MTSPLKRVTDILDVRNFKRVKLMKQNVSVLFLKICFFESEWYLSSEKDTIQANTWINCTFQQQRSIIAFYSLKRA